MEDSILTVDQVAQIIQVHPFTVLKFIKQGKLKAAKLGRVYRIRRMDVDKFIDGQVETSQKKDGSAQSKKEKTKKSTAPISSTKETSGDSRLTVESKEEAMKEEINIAAVPPKKTEEPLNQLERVKPKTAPPKLKEPKKNEDRSQNDSDHYIIKVNF